MNDNAIKIHCAYDALVPISDIKPNPKNRNKHGEDQINMLVEIIKYQGFRSPLVVSNRSGMLVHGHGRLLAAHKLGLLNVPVIYMGSKSKICKDVFSLFPRADNFYDLFGGGFSITHYMLKYRSNHYKQFHFNEIRPGVCDLIKDAISGKYNYDIYKPEWVSREEFFKRIDTDPLIKILWSFGNNGKTYLFGTDIEPYKKSMHMAVVFNEFDDTAKQVLGMDRFKDGLSITDKRLFLRYKVAKNNSSLRPTELQQLQQLQQLERLQQLQQLERLERLQQLEFYSTSYEQVPIKPNSVIYCDIPYKGTNEYDKNDSFDHSAFLEWAHSQTEPVFISEYQISDTRFKCVASIKKRSLLSGNRDNTLVKVERVYVNQAGYRALINQRK